ncbi:GNAT family N-acetyltransferase [Arthrobacter sp. TMN-37]
MSQPDCPALPDSLTWRPIDAQDIGPWHELILRMAAEDKPDWIEERADLEQALGSSKNDPREDTILGLDAEGTVRAFGRVSMNPDSVKVHSAGGVDPAWRRRGIGRAVFAWQKHRARARLARAGVEGGVLRTYVEERNPSHVALLELTGSTVVRYFTEMTRPLADPIPELAIPAELDLVTFHDAISDGVRLAHNDAFADHWGSEPRDDESWGFVTAHPEFRADWSLALVDRETGAVAAYQMASYDPGSIELLGRAEGYTDLLGVRRAWRGRGLAPALLAEAMRRFRAGGMDSAGLGVDTENPTGALGLYERMGYRPTQRSLVFDLPVT